MSEEELIRAVEPFVVQFQALVRGHIARKRLRKRSTMTVNSAMLSNLSVRDQAYRENVAREILATEEVYLKSMRTLSEVFLK